MAWISSKLRKRNVTAKNGNCQIKNVIKISHWNAGNQLWQNKRLEIEALILDNTPDLLFITEANLMASVPNCDRYIEGYTLYLPETVAKHDYAQIVLLAKEGVDITVNKEFMNEDVAVIWISVRNGRRKLLQIRGIYREHRLLLKPKPNVTTSYMAQLERWNTFLSGGRRVSPPVCSLEEIC